MHLDKVQDKIIEEFEFMVDQVKSQYRYFRHLVNVAALLPTQAAFKRTNEKLIQLTRSKVWLDAEFIDGKVYFTADSDSHIMKSLLQLYLRVFSGRTPHEIVNSNLYFTDEINLDRFLSADRRTELSSVLQRMRSVAAGFKVKSLKAAG